MDRVRFIEHRGKKILLIDYSNLTDEQEELLVVAERKEVVSSQPPKSLLTLTDLTGARVTRGTLDAAKMAAVLDVPYVKRAAVVGAQTAVPKGQVEAVETFSNREWAEFVTREEALEWLVAEELERAQAS